MILYCDRSQRCSQSFFKRIIEMVTLYTLVIKLKKQYNVRAVQCLAFIMIRQEAKRERDRERSLSRDSNSGCL